ncbi:hypothetical protein APHAL10511_002445 [Amanita phalloides]|nr:hypothetical protein APHAL10511_002445 [Amanita phalloides]
MSLPTHHTSSDKSRFVVQSEPAQMSSGTRYLSDDEIVEHLIHNPSKAICWSIHKPKRGWYIRLRHPSFPPGTFIPFIPVPPSSPYHTEGALSFNLRTNHVINSSTESSRPASIQDGTNRSNSRTSIHSYPPLPPAAVVRPRPMASAASNDAAQPTPVPSTPPTPPRLIPRVPYPMQITQFILAPHSMAPQVPTTDSLFSRALSMIKNHRPSHSRSFTLSRVSHSPQTPPPPYTSQSVVNLDANVESGFLDLPLTPFLVHHDRTPILTVGSYTGLIEIDTAEERMLGVDRSFWIAISLTYLEFLGNRESYLAALND